MSYETGNGEKERREQLKRVGEAFAVREAVGAAYLLLLMLQVPGRGSHRQIK